MPGSRSPVPGPLQNGFAACFSRYAAENGNSPPLPPPGTGSANTSSPISGRLRFSPANWDRARIVVQSLKSGERKVLIDGGTAAHYVPTGHIVYALGSTLLAIPFDIHKRQTIGGSVPVVEDVGRATAGLGGGYEAFFRNFACGFSGLCAGWQFNKIHS